MKLMDAQHRLGNLRLLAAAAGLALLSAGIGGGAKAQAPAATKDLYGTLGAKFGGRMMRGKAPLYQVTVTFNPQSLGATAKLMVPAGSSAPTFDLDSEDTYVLLAPPLRPSPADLTSYGQTANKQPTNRDLNLLNLGLKLKYGLKPGGPNSPVDKPKIAPANLIQRAYVSRNPRAKNPMSANKHEPASAAPGNKKPKLPAEALERYEMVVIKAGDTPISGPPGDHADLATLRKHRNLVRFVKPDINKGIAYMILEPAAVSNGDKVYVGLGHLKDGANSIDGDTMFSDDESHGYVERARALEDYDSVVWHTADGKTKAEVLIDTLPTFTFGVNAVNNEDILTGTPDTKDATKTDWSTTKKSVEHYPFTLDVDTIVGAKAAARTPHRFLGISADPVDFQYVVPLVLNTNAAGVISSEKLDTGTHVEFHFAGQTPLLTHASFTPAFFDMNVRGNQDWTYSRWEALFGLRFSYLPDTSGDRWFRETDINQAWHANIGVSANQWWLIDKRFDDAGVTAKDGAINTQHRKAVYIRFPMGITRKTSFAGLDIDFAYQGVAFPDRAKTGGFGNVSTWNTLITASLTYKVPKTSQSIMVKWTTGKSEDTFYQKSSTFSVGVKSAL